MEPNNPSTMSQTPVPTPDGDKSVGPAIGVVIIVLIVVLGGLYFWGQRVSQEQAQTPQNTNSQGVGIQASTSAGYSY